MNAAIAAVIVFVCVTAGTIIGLVLHKRIPEHHFSSESRDAVKLAIGMIATLTAMVLGLLVSSAKSTFDDLSDSLTQGSAKLIMLDRAMARYGPETQPIRQMLRNSIVTYMNAFWPDNHSRTDITIYENQTPTMELVSEQLRQLTPQNDSQRAFQSEAIQICGDILQTRWLTLEQTQASLPRILYVMLLIWLTTLFCGFGLLSPPNKTVIISLIICAISVSGAIFLIEEMSKPFGGFVKVSNAPIVKAVEHLGK